MYFDDFNCEDVCGPGRFSQVPSVIGSLPELGPPKYTPEEQAANPTKPMTRLVKDILRVGYWRCGQSEDGKTFMWNVQQATLETLRSTFNLHQERGIPHQLVWGHSDHKHNVDARDIIQQIDKVWVNGDTLYCSIYVTPAEAAELLKSGMQVSVRVVWDWADGKNRRYPMSLMHVAVVDHGIVDFQGPFVNMGVSLQNKKANKRMMTFDTVKSVIESVTGKTLPESVTEDNFDDVVPVWAEAIAGGAPEEEADAEVEAEVGDPEVVADLGKKGAAKPTADLSAEAPAWAKNLVTQVADLGNQVKGLVQTGTNSRKNAFLSRLDGLKGSLTVKQMGALRKTGSASNWDTDLLDGIGGDAAPDTVDFSAVAKGQATGAPPKGAKTHKSTDADGMTLEELNKCRAAMNLPSKKSL